MKEKLNNAGLTLIELVVAIAMSSVILGAVFMFFTGAQRAYHTAEYGIDLQMEGQILMEQIGNWVMESSRIVVSQDNDVVLLYSIPVDHNNGLTAADYPVEYTPKDSSASCRIIFLADAVSGPGKSLYMKTVTGITDADAHIQTALNAVDNATFYSDADVIDENCIGDLIDTFEAYIPSGEDRSQLSSVGIRLNMQKATKGYALENRFSIRNGIFQVIDNSPTPTPTTEP